MADQVELRLTFLKSTPGTHVYGTNEQDPTTRQIYLSKSSPLFATSKPDYITVVIKAGV